MKTRKSKTMSKDSSSPKKRPYGPQPRNTDRAPKAMRSVGRRDSGPRDGGRDGGRARPPRPVGDRPTVMVAQVIREGAYLRGRVLQRDLVNIDFEVLEGELELNTGDFAEVVPESNESKRLIAKRKVPANEAATWAAICNHALRVEWPEGLEHEVSKLPAYQWNADDKRVDWRKLAIVTIDGADARDFDDAVWAESWEDGGHHIIVAIADVAQYVKEGSALDREAVLRGNSTYFPDRVLPMLPERLSNDLCSLRPHEDRPVLGVEMWIGKDGRLRKHIFKRGCIHSAARLTYEQVQGVFDGEKNMLAPEILDGLQRLRDAYATLANAREKRGALDLDIPEVKLEVTDGKISKVGVRARLEAHRLIEELMILANVAAATTLSTKGGGLYRIHPEPSKEKLENLKATMGPLGFTVPAPNGGPKAWAKLVAQINEHPASQTLLRAVLQSQSQAKYDPNNIGHYGLALPLYSHFTSPIRRYADLVVHRALLKTMFGKADKGNIAPEDMIEAGRIADGINATERKSQQAEWESRDRLVAQHFAELVGKTFEGVVISVVPFGCFVSVAGVAEGLLPKWVLWDEFVYVGSLNVWRKKQGKFNLRVGSRVTVTLTEADALGGRLTFGLAKETAVYKDDSRRENKDYGAKATANAKRGEYRAQPEGRFEGRSEGRSGAHSEARPYAPAGRRPEARREDKPLAEGEVPRERSARMEKPKWMIEKEAGRLRPLKPRTRKEILRAVKADAAPTDTRKGVRGGAKSGAAGRPKRRG